MASESEWQSPAIIICCCAHHKPNAPNWIELDREARILVEPATADERSAARLQQWLRELIRELTRELGAPPKRGKAGKRRLSLLHSDIALA